MHTVDIEIFRIAQTRMNDDQLRKWLDRCGAHQTPVPGDEISSGEAVCAFCAKRCYMAFEPGLNPNVTRVRKDWHEYLENIVNSGHGSVLEHATYTYAIEGVSRVFTAEMNRHRAGVAISEGSMRYIRLDDIGFWMPDSLLPESRTLMPTARCKPCKGQGCIFCVDGRVDTLDEVEFLDRKEQTRELFRQSFQLNEDYYKHLCYLWDIENLKDFDTKKKLTSMFRRLIGMGVATGGTWTLNLRALRHVVALRTSPHAEEEIIKVIGLIAKDILQEAPSVMSDFTEENGTWTPGKWKI